MFLAFYHTYKSKAFNSDKKFYKYTNFFILFITLNFEMEGRSLIPVVVPTENITDILVFLNRNEMEKCQYICQNWDSIIKQNASILPLRKFGPIGIGIDEWKVSFAPIEQEGNDIIWYNLNNESEEVMAKFRSMKYGIFMSINNQYHVI